MRDLFIILPYHRNILVACDRLGASGFLSVVRLSSGNWVMMMMIKMEDDTLDEKGSGHDDKD